MIQWLVLASGLVLVLRYGRHLASPASDVNTVAVVVLGDVARSPRMCRHARSFLDKGFNVHLVGYLSTPLPRDLAERARLRTHDVRPPAFLTPSRPLSRPLFFLFAPVKIVTTSFLLLHVLLFRFRKRSWVLVQTPPAIPTLPIVASFAWLTGAKMVVDWHNTAWSILALRFGGKQNHPLVRVARWLERVSGRHAAVHLFVTRAEKDHLVKEWDLRGRAVVFYDRPPKDFRRLSPDEMHQFWLRSIPLLTVEDPSLRPALDIFSPPTGDASTPFSTELTATAELRPSRPAVMVSSTSWTADEDFSLLIDALSLYALSDVPPSSTPASKTEPSDGSGDDWVHASVTDDDVAPHQPTAPTPPTKTSRLPDLICFVTGRGPLRSHYLSLLTSRAASEQWLSPPTETGRPRVSVHSVWLDDPDYPKLLGCADIGVSLHVSSSGLDLPMKVVDCFGCGVPILAKDFACVQELVKPGVNGHLFTTAEQLADQIKGLLNGYPADSRRLEALRDGISTAEYGVGGWSSWQEEWDRVVYPSLSSL